MTKSKYLRRPKTTGNILRLVNEPFHRCIFFFYFIDSSTFLLSSWKSHWNTEGSTHGSPNSFITFNFMGEKINKKSRSKVYNGVWCILYCNKNEIVSTLESNNNKFQVSSSSQVAQSDRIQYTYVQHSTTADTGLFPLVALHLCSIHIIIIFFIHTI